MAVNVQHVDIDIAFQPQLGKGYLYFSGSGSGSSGGSNSGGGTKCPESFSVGQTGLLCFTQGSGSTTREGDEDKSSCQRIVWRSRWRKNHDHSHSAVYPKQSSCVEKMGAKKYIMGIFNTVLHFFLNVTLVYVHTINSLSLYSSKS